MSLAVPERKRVLMLLGFYSYKMHLGIARYAREADWVLNATMASTRRVPTDWNADGIIAFNTWVTDISEEIRRQQKPVVDLSSFHKNTEHPRIYSDQIAIGRMGAEHLLDRGFQFFGYVGGVGERLAGRCKGFRQCVENAGKQFFDIPRSRMLETIERFPKPLGLMVTNDRRAIPVLDEIVSSGLSIPHDIALVSVDNDELQNAIAAIPLSSIDTNAELRGYEAAKLLDSLMNGVPVPDTPVTIQPRCVITRASTDTMAISDADVQEALKIIHKQFSDPIIDLSEVAATVGITRQHLDNKFKAHLGHTMYEELTRIRLKEATRLLRDTDHFAKTVARLSGFSSTDHLSTTLEKYHGVRTREYKKQLHSSR